MSEENSNPTPPPPVSRKRTRKVAKVEASEAVEALLNAKPAPVEEAADPAESTVPSESGTTHESGTTQTPLVSELTPIWPLAAENAIGTLSENEQLDSLPDANPASLADQALESAMLREQNLASTIVQGAIHDGIVGAEMGDKSGEEYPGELDPTQDPPVVGELAQPDADEAARDETEASAEAPVDPTELERTVEALLFAAMEPISVREIARAADSNSATIRKVIKALKETGDREHRPWDLVEVAGAYRFVTRAEFHPAILRLKTQVSQRKLTQAALETLALIAYRQPIGRAEIESVRGVNAGPVLRLLLEKKLVQISGRGTGVGQPLLYATTDYFLENFGLKNVTELPKPGEFKNA